jgi:hypothetical protein
MAHLDIATSKIAWFRKERRIHPAGHSIKRTRCRMIVAFHRSVQMRPGGIEVSDLRPRAKISILLPHEPR